MGEIVTPQDKSKLFSIMKTQKIASLLKIYGPQIIPKRQRTFPSEHFPLVQSASLSTWLCAELPPASSVCSGGPREGSAHTTCSANILSVCFCLRAAPQRPLGRVPFFPLPQPAPQMESQFKAYGHPVGVRPVSPHPSSTKCFCPGRGTGTGLL